MTLLEKTAFILRNFFMPRKILPAQALVLTTDILPLSQGGTGSSTASGAVSNLGAILLSQRAAPLGVATLDANGLIPMSQIPSAVINAVYIVISGPISLGIGLQGTYTIVNYDSTQTYTITAISGTVSSVNDTIVYTAPSTPGSGGFIVDGQINTVTIIDPANEPTVTGPTSLLENQAGSYTITNYNATSTYSVTATQGTVSMSGATVTYTAPPGDGINVLSAGFSIVGPNHTTAIVVTINPPAVPVVTGPLSTPVGTTAVYTITNYTAPATYIATTTNGTVTFNPANGTVSYTAPSVVGNYTFTVNSVTVPVQVTVPQIQTPSVVSPLNGTTNLGPNVTFGSSAFTMLGGSDTQKSASWQVSAAGDNTFTQPLTASNMNSTVNLSYWTSPVIPSNGTYFVRVQYTGAQGGVSAWSTPVGFSTKTFYAANAITARISSNVATSWFGSSVALSSDGTIALIGAQNEASNVGAAYIYQNVSGTWTQIVRVSSATGSYFGNTVALSADGTIGIIGSYGESTNQGAAYLYQNQAGTWTQIAKITTGTVSANFGQSVALSSTGTIACIGASTENSNIGAAYIYQNVSGTWTQIARVTSAVAGGYFGQSVSLSSDGTIALIGAYQENSNAGAVYLYQNQAGTWTQTAHVTGTAASGYFGISVGLNTDGTIAVIGASNENSVTGAAYIYQNVSGTWTSMSRLATNVTNGLLGSSVSINSDGSIVLITAPGEYSGYVYQNQSGSWVQIARLTSGVTGSNFGSSCFLNSTGTLGLIGADGENTYAGAAYIAS
jgi:hypothetical protein